MYNIKIIIIFDYSLKAAGLRITYTGHQLNNSKNDSMSFYTRTPVIRPLQGNEKQF